MDRSFRRFFVICGVLTTALASLGTARAAVSFEDKVVSVYVSSSPGGGLDLYGRIFARYSPKYLPGHPTMVPKNMPGAGGLLLANQLATTLPKDGTAIAAVTNGLYLSQLLGVKNAHYDAAKFNWVGRLADLPLLLVSSRTSKIKTARDMLDKEFAVSVTGPGSYGFLVLSAVKNVLGGKLKLVSGYPSGGANRLAMERGEVDGTASVQWTIKDEHDWVVDNKANLLAQIALTSYPDLKSVPLLSDLTNDPGTKRILNMFIAPAEIGRGFTLPSGVPQDIVKIYRTAFVKMTKDLEFLAEAKKLTLDINVLDGEALQAVVIESGKVSPGEIAQAQSAVAAAQDAVSTTDRGKEAK
jgi:tripartite-type tricarboxylate transporter receptor subunit TctC